MPLHQANHLLLQLEMGCVSDKEKKAAAGDQGKQMKDSKQAPPKTAAAAPSIKKLSPAEIAKKREDMRYNLLEGHSQPPNVAAPHFGSVTTFDTYQ